MGKEIGRPFFTRPRQLTLTVDAMGLGVKSSVVWINAGQRRQHEGLTGRIPIDALINVIAVHLGAGHFSARIHVLRNGGASWIKVVREADNGSGICIPEWPLQGEVAVGCETDN